MELLPHFFASFVFLILSETRHLLGCFHDVEPLHESTVWTQSTSPHSYLHYEFRTSGNGAPDTTRLYVSQLGKDRSNTNVIRCLRSYPGNIVLVERGEGSRDSTTSYPASFQCLKFESKARRVILLYTTVTRSSESEIADCRKEKYNSVTSLLIANTQQPPEPCPLHGSYLVSLQESQEGRRSTACSATFRFGCNNEIVLANFDEDCSPPIYKYFSNTVLARIHDSHRLECVGNWTEEGSGLNVLIMRMRKKDDSLMVWSLHYKTIDGTLDLLLAFLTFDGSYLPEALTDSVDDYKNSMQGTFARIVSSSHEQCSNKDHLNRCKTTNVNCSMSSSCPSECKRCYSIPKIQSCKFHPNLIGSWETDSSYNGVTVTVTAAGIKTSSDGEFVCRYSAEKSVYINPVVQYEDARCSPLYACTEIFSLAPGVAYFYLRQTISTPEEVAGEPSSCSKTNDIFKTHPVETGSMKTLLNLEKLKKSPCNFGASTQYPTSKGLCLLNVTTCSGKCDKLTITYDNETCHQEGEFSPLVPSHQCYASLKLQDGIRGMITYSDVLEKYSCWIYTSTRLFVTPLSMCNHEGVRSVYMDKRAADKYDPSDAFTIPLNDQSSGGIHRVPLLTPLIVSILGANLIQRLIILL